MKLERPRKRSRTAAVQAPQLAAFHDDGGNAEADAPSNSKPTGEALAEMERLKSVGQDHAGQERWQEALVSWDAALVLSPSHAELYALRAQVLLELGRDWEAIQSATKATQLEPESATAFLTLGRAQLNFGEPRLALGSFQRVLSLQPHQPDALAELATVQMLALQQQQAGSGHRFTVRNGGGPLVGPATGTTSDIG